MKAPKWMLVALILPALLVLPAVAYERDDDEWDEAHEMAELVELMEHYVELTFDLERSALLGVGSITDMDISEKHKAEILEELLSEVETQGIRNAIHLALKDMYLEMENEDKALHHIRAMVIESDGMLVEMRMREFEEWDEDEDEWEEDEHEEHEDDD